jgi:hypothetical protein
MLKLRSQFMDRSILMTLFRELCYDTFNFEVKEMVVNGLIVGKGKGNFIAFVITNRPIEYKQISLFT